jgi:hypothetical protein
MVELCEALKLRSYFPLVKFLESVLRKAQDEGIGCFEEEGDNGRVERRENRKFAINGDAPQTH